MSSRDNLGVKNHMLHIICPNTAIDVRIELEHFAHGVVQRAIGSTGYASGKGVNSAFTCDFLGISTGLHAMVGTLDEDYFSAVGLTSVDAFLSVFPGETRRNLTIIDKNGLVSHIQTTGFSVDEIGVDKFIKGACSNIKNGGVALISGSLPKGFSHEKLFELVRKVRELGASIVLDTDLFRIDQNVGMEIDFVKPNIEELNAYLERHSISGLDMALKRLSDLGVKQTIVTCGSRGAYIFNANGEKTLFARSNFDSPGKEAIGSGDAFIGAFAGSLSNGDSQAIALEHAIAAGHSNIFHDGPGRIGNTFHRILETAQSEEINRSVAIQQVTALLHEV